MRLERIDHVAITVRDMLRSVAWYEQVLGFRRAGRVDADPPVKLVLDQQWLAIFPARDGSANTPGKGDLAIQHIAFGIDRRGFEGALRELEAHSVETKFVDHGNCHSVYFDDPDGHRLEIVTYDLA